MSEIPFSQLGDHLDKAAKGVLADTQNFFLKSLYPFINREVQATFKSVCPSGTASQKVFNRTEWKGYNVHTLHPTYEGSGGYINYKKWNERTGTDGSKGKYSESSLMNIKSGTFMRSFNLISLSPQRMVYGSEHPIAHKLLKDRPVINYDDTMKQQFQTLFSGWLGKTYKSLL